jgi:hypothetical protein
MAERWLEPGMVWAKPEPDPIIAAVDAALAVRHVVFHGDRFNLTDDDREALERVRKLFSEPSIWANKLGLSADAAHIPVGAVIRARRDRERHPARLASTKKVFASAEAGREALTFLTPLFDDREAFDSVQRRLTEIYDDASDLIRQSPRQVDAATSLASAGAYLAIVMHALTNDSAPNALILDLIQAAFGEQLSERGLSRALLGVVNRVGPLT